MTSTPAVHSPATARSHRARTQPCRDWPRSWAVVGALLLVTGLGLGLVVTTLGAGATGEQSLDGHIAADRFDALVSFARFVDVAIGPALAATLLAVVCVGIWACHSLRIAIVFGALTSAGWLSSLVGKAIVARPRPPQSVHPLVLETAHDSFPSGHTAFAAAFVAATVATLWLLGHRVRAVAWLGALLVAVVGASRLVLGAHYLADVVGAPLFAVGAVALVAGLWRNPAGLTRD